MSKKNFYFEFILKSKDCKSDKQIYNSYLYIFVRLLFIILKMV